MPEITVKQFLGIANGSVGTASVVVGVLSRDPLLFTLGVVSLSLAALFLGVIDDA